MNVTVEPYVNGAPSRVAQPSPYSDKGDTAADVLAPQSGEVVIPETPTDAARVRALATLGPVIRIATGFPALDGAMRGGVPLPRYMVVGGAPGVGKTSFAVGQGIQCARLAIPAVILAKDEGVEGIDQRIALLIGLDVERLENRDPEAIEALAQFYDQHPLRVLDGDDGHTVESAAAVLASMRKDGEPAVLILDSGQTVDAEGTDTAKSPRERADAVMRATKVVTRKHMFWTIMTSELNRGYYRSKRNEEAINPLAAFKESGGIEYGAQTALVLTSVEGDGSMVDVQVPKNRGYPKVPFFLKIDPRTTEVTEAEAPATPEGEPAAERFQKTRDRIVRTCAKVSDLGSATKIHAAVGGEKSYTLKLIKALIEDGDLVLIGAGYRPKQGAA